MEHCRKLCIRFWQQAISDHIYRLKKDTLYGARGRETPEVTPAQTLWPEVEGELGAGEGRGPRPLSPDLGGVALQRIADKVTRDLVSRELMDTPGDGRGAVMMNVIRVDIL